MKKILLLFLVAQSAHGIMQEQERVSVILRKTPFLVHHSAKKGTPLLLTVVNSKNIPLLISPASVSLSLLTFGQVHSILMSRPTMEQCNAFISYFSCLGGMCGALVYTLLKTMDADLDATAKAWRIALGSVSCISFGYIGVAVLLSIEGSRIPLSMLESHYLYLPTVIKPFGSLDKLIWLESEKPNSLKISLFLPDNNSLDFNFTADQLEAIA